MSKHTSAKLSTLVRKAVDGMSAAELAAFRRELRRALPGFVSEAAQKAKLSTVQDGDKEDERVSK